MAKRGRLWAACLTAAASASAAASFAADPAGAEFGELRRPPRYFGETPAEAAAAAAGGPERVSVPAPNLGSPIVGFPALARPQARPVGRQGAVREYARPAATGWVALVGEFKKPGSYEIAGSGASLRELLGRCDGLTGRATRTLRVVRNGRPATVLLAGAESPAVLRPGDVLVADGSAERRFGVVATSYEDRGNPAAQRANVQLGIVGLSERPVAVKVPGDYATVEGVLTLSRQAHLSPRDVTVLVGGSRKVAGNQVVELTSGSVLVFDPRDVATDAVGELPTNYYPVQSTAELPAEAVPAAPTLTTHEALLTSAPGFAAPSLESLGPTRTAEATSPAAMSMVPPPPGDEMLSPLPAVESLDPPADEPPLGFPRTADASGSVPIGRPEIAEPHIMSVPADSLFGPREPRIPTEAAAPAPPLPPDSLGPASSTGPADSIDSTVEEPAAEEELSLTSLAATVLAGGALGALTFLILRRLRGRRLLKPMLDRIHERISVQTQPAIDEHPTIGRLATSRGMAPSDLLAALVADRLAFREEPIELPAMMRVFGRSTGLKKRRIDPPAAGIPEPHIPLGVPGEAQSVEATTSRKSARTNVRIDDAEPMSPPSGLTGGTPFERALAARRRATARQ